VVRYSELSVGQRLRVVPPGAPTFAEIGDIVEVTATSSESVTCRNSAGRTAIFERPCGARRLELVAARPVLREVDDGAADG